MIGLSDDPQLAERQMTALIYYLTTFGYVDGDFDPSERKVVRSFIERLITARVSEALPSPTALRRELIAKFSAHFNEVLEWVDSQVRAMFDESVARDEPQEAFVKAQLTRRCFEVFVDFDEPSQKALMDTVDELLIADGVVHPAEVRFRSELAEILGSEQVTTLQLPVEPLPAGHTTIDVAQQLPHGGQSHPFLDTTEEHYSADPLEIVKQTLADRTLIDRVVALLETRRRAGRGRLEGRTRIDQVLAPSTFLDGHVYVAGREPNRRYELTVLGDLHGCYSCLKAALMQSQFFRKVDAFNRDPLNQPEPKLVMLGDYIDRGRFSLNGVLRAALQIYAAAPDYVCLLRGNHEYFVEHEGTIYAGVRPAEAIETLRPYAPDDIFRHYMALFKSLPNMLFFDRMLFVHGGLPRDRTAKERLRDLSGLNDPTIRFEMMWSDPSSANVVPAALQARSARFPFGRLQFQAFMQRLGCHTLIRGHEKIDEGFRTVYDDPPYRLITLFSAGGRNNLDLPAESSYRTVTPMALTVTAEGEDLTIRSTLR